jgi:hypothetical protein
LQEERLSEFNNFESTEAWLASRTACLTVNFLGGVFFLFAKNMTCTTPTTKICTLCKQPKDADQFNKHGGHRDGLGSNCRQCIKEAARMRRAKAVGIQAHQTRPDAPQLVKAIKSLPNPKPLPQVDPELVIDIPGIWEIQNRGKNYITYNFTSPIDQTTFTFSSFKQARQAHQEMMKAFRQQAVFESVRRQSTGKKLAVDDEDDK